MTPRVSELVTATPATRNRVVDLLRAGAIVVVVLGHWVMQGVYVDGSGTLHRQGLLGIAPWTHPFTWVFQVMPVIFVVGGFANAGSWRSAVARGDGYGCWLAGRARRLTRPLLPVLAFWAIATPSAAYAGLGADWLRVAGKASLVPTWFLAVYLLVVATVPVTLWCWDRWRLGSVLAGLLAAGVVDAVSIGADIPVIGYLNGLLVWATLHQLGYAWRAGSLHELAGWGAVTAFGVLVGLVALGPYGVSMVGVTGFGVDNTSPPRVTLLLLGLGQIGTAIAVEPWLARRLTRRRVWTAVVAVNSRIVTLYVWHLTVLGLVLAVALWTGGRGLHASPGSADWWWSRPAWFAVLAVGTAVAVWAFGRLENPEPHRSRHLSGPRVLGGVVVVSLGLAALARWGVARPDGTLLWWLPWLPLAAIVAGLWSSRRSP